MKPLSIGLLLLGVIGLLAAGYLFSFGVALESACHMNDAEACARLAQTTRLSGALALAGIALFMAGLIRLVVRRLGHQSAE